MGVSRLEDEPRLADARLPDDSRYLAAPLPGLLQGTVKLLALGIPPHEA